MRELGTNLVALSAILALLSSTSYSQSPAPRSGESEVQITAEKMCCKGCAQKVSGQLYTLKGVKSVSVDLSTHTVNVMLPNPSASTLGRIWHAVEQGNGGPTSLSTSTAAYQLVRPQDEQELGAAQQMGSSMHIVIDNLHCKGCAQKVAAQLYAIKGVTRVNVDMQRETLIVETNQKTPVSPWLVIDAVSAAKERAVAVRGNYGTLAITWSTEAAPKSNHQAQQTLSGGIQR
ncbi:cation transporter [Aeoliella sp. ICT_H6.2]|uniref:Cation transporter n=1 Tax=Aeoliella straminimaris TaxID=2954799 RepID=A0A9X2JEZ2_9BACT|nr:cation transporter [Aeoliella straminimaris]MCO6042717.1 cation transporter [Aeoliella straminimaris]